jgi:hypothetical protein
MPHADPDPPALSGEPEAPVDDGGWFEWSIDEERPLETGIPEQVPRAFS